MVAYVCGEDRQAAGHGLHDGVGRPFIQGGAQSDVRLLIEIRHRLGGQAVLSVLRIDQRDLGPLASGLDDGAEAFDICALSSRIMPGVAVPLGHQGVRQGRGGGKAIHVHRIGEIHHVVTVGGQLSVGGG